MLTKWTSPWISVKDRLPKIDEDILIRYYSWEKIAISKAKLKDDRYISELDSEDDKYYWLPVNAEQGPLFEEVTHWMTIPLLKDRD